MKNARSGNLMVLALILALIIFVGVSSMDYLTRADVSATTNLVRELKATYLAESIAAQIESRANRHPWELRFWLIEAQAAGTVTPGSGIMPSVTFNRSTSHVDLSGDATPSTEYDFVGVVKDVDSGMKDYRIYVEVNYQGTSFTFSWDKRYQESLLGGMNRNTSRLDKQLEETAANTVPTDQLIDGIKSSAAAPAPGTLSPEFLQLLDTLRTDERTYAGATETPPEPAGSPSPLPPPQY
ncbi:MAG: hypothetical protein HY815_19410 [Candidatus Riflebacteria bacterium]|nr:hypothetical protein [Candidatus Riflebacteria bacterium]